MPKKSIDALRRLRNSFFRPIFMAIITFIVVVVLIFSTFFFRSVYLSLEQDVYDIAKSQADLSASSISSLLTDYFNLSAKIVNDQKLSRKSYNRSHREALEALMNYNLSFYKYDNLMLYYPGESYLLTLHGTCTADVAFPNVTDCHALLADISQSGVQTVFNTLDYGADLRHSQVIFSYSLKQDMVVLFVLDHANMHSILGSARTVRSDSLHMILDRAGRILYTDALPEQSLLDELHTMRQQSASVKQVRVHDKNYFYIQSALPNQLEMITLNRVVNQFDVLHRMVNTTLLCCTLVIILGLSVLIVSIRHGYLPIAELTKTAQNLINLENEPSPANDISALRQVFTQYVKLSQENSRNAQLMSSTDLKEMFILRVINGRYASEHENAHICAHLGLSFPYNHFCACVLLWDRTPTSDELSRLDHALNALSGKDFAAHFCQSDDRCSALGIINFAQGSELPMIGRQILSSLCNANPDMPAPTIAIGHSYDDMQGIPASYIEARAALDYRLVFGTHTVILYDYLRCSEANESEYPRHLLDAFFSGLMNWDVESITCELNNLTQYIRETPLTLQQVKCVCMEISTAFMREAHHISSAYPLYDESFDVFHICEYASIDDLADHVTKFSCTIQQYLRSSEILCQDKDIKRCLNILNENIANCQFSLEALSEQFSVSSQTLRRRFKKATGKTMNDYMTALRLEKAKQLLEDTQLELADICAQCGYNDLSSFIRVFKSKLGETPGKYRETHTSSNHRL